MIACGSLYSNSSKLLSVNITLEWHLISMNNSLVLLLLHEKGHYYYYYYYYYNNKHNILM